MPTRSIDSLMPILAISGANGFVGRHLVRAACLRDLDVHAISREADSIPPAGKIKSFTTRGPDGTVDYAGWPGGADVFIHLAGRAHVLTETAADPRLEYRKANVFDTLQVAHRAYETGAQRFVFVSSIGVHGIMSPDGPVSPRSPLCPQGEYAASKLEAELRICEFAAKRSWDVVIVRPPLMYGPGVGANFLRLIRLADSGLPLPLGGIVNRRSFLGVDNFVDFILYAAKRNSLASGVYIPADEEVTSTSELITQIRILLGRKDLLFKAPKRLVKFICNAFGRPTVYTQLFESLWVEYGNLLAQSGWAPPFAQSKLLSQTIDWYLNTRGHNER